MTDTGLTIPDITTAPVTMKLTSAAAIRNAISAAISESVPEGKTGAAGAIVSSDGSMHVFLASKIGENWMVSTDVTKDGKRVSGTVKIAGAW